MHDAVGDRFPSSSPTPSPSLASSTTAAITVRRIDLGALKSRLQTALSTSSSNGKDNFSSYWDNLRKYVQTKLSKRELDQIARSLLGDDHLHLHNVFIHAILTNARNPRPPEIPPPLPRPHQQRSLDKKKPFTKPLPNASSHPASLANSLVNVNTMPSAMNFSGNASINPSLSLSGFNSSSPSMGNGGMLSGSSSKLKSATKKFLPPRSTPAANVVKTNISGGFDKSQLRPSRLPPKKVVAPPLGPEYNVLRLRLQKIATEAGLSGITQDAIQYIMVAIEAYIKQIIHHTKPVTRPRSVELPAPTFLTLNDFYRTAALHPCLLGEDFLLHQEHLSLALL